jgi:HD superfamily phosphohydrolase
MAPAPGRSPRPCSGAAADLHALAGSVLQSTAFARLTGLTFLGILSPRYGGARGVAEDGDRGDHSVGVAAIAVELARRLGLSAGAQRYAAAWGLVHDVATWPLSHTSEPAFTRLTGVSARALRAMMILGDRRLPAALRLDRALAEMGVSPRSLLGLFGGAPAGASIELDLLGQLIRSRLTPDTLEGIFRSGRAYGVPVPDPEQILAVLGRNLFEVTVAPGGLQVVREFWRAKARVYRAHINTPSAARRDSTWSRAIEKALPGISLGASLELTEEDVVRAVQERGLPEAAAEERYKPRHGYSFCARTARRLAGWVPVAALNRVLLKTRARGVADGSWRDRAPSINCPRALV